MADVVSKQKRSAIMGAVLSRGNQLTEVRLAKLFRHHGVKGWRRHLPLAFFDGTAAGSRLFFEKNEAGKMSVTQS